MYNPTDLYDCNKEEFDKYFENLIKQIGRFRHTLEDKKIDSVYFGGGTPSIMPMRVLEKIAELIPNWGKISVKVFEANPLSTNITKMKKLVSLGFTYITFGVQTLDKEELRRQHRRYSENEHLKEITKYAVDHGMAINYDLLALMNDDNQKDADRIYNDLVTIMEEYKPTAIDIYPNVYKLEGTYKEVSDRLIPLRKSILKALFKNKEYHLGLGMERIKVDKEEVLNTRKNNYYIINVPDEIFFGEMKSYLCSGPPNNPKNQNTLSFGGYNNAWVYSYTGGSEKVYFSKIKESGNLEYKIRGEVMLGE